MRKTKKLLISFSFVVTMAVVSCSKNEVSSDSVPEGVISSSFSKSEQSSEPLGQSMPEIYLCYYSPDEAEAFDVEKSYLGMSLDDFCSMGMKYTFLPMIGSTKFAKSLWEDLYSSSTIYSFRFGDLDVFAKGTINSNEIEKFTTKQKKLMTVSEARECGFFHHKGTEDDVWNLRYQLFLTRPTTETFWVSDLKDGLDVPASENFFEQIQRYGAWDAMMVFLDLNTIYCWPNAISAFIRSGIPIYSDDLSEVVGVSVLSSSNDNYQFRTYMKEDGYNEKITLEQYSEGIRGAGKDSTNFGRAAFYFEPSEFVYPGPVTFYNLLGGTVDV